MCRCFRGFHGKSLIIEVCLSRRSGYRPVSFYLEPNLLLLLLLSPPSPLLVRLSAPFCGSPHSERLRETRKAPVSVSSVLIRRAFVSSEGSRTVQIWTMKRPLKFCLSLRYRGRRRANYLCRGIVRRFHKGNPVGAFRCCSRLDCARRDVTILLPFYFEIFFTTLDYYDRSAIR